MDFHGLSVEKQKSEPRYPVAGLSACSLDTEWLLC